MEALNIKTPRLEVRPLKSEDLSDFYAYRKLEEVAKFQGYEPFDLEEAGSFIAEHAQKPFAIPGEWKQFGIVLLSSNKLIGDCAIKFDHDDPRLAEVGITISPGYQQNGYAKEVLAAILEFLFERKDFHRVQETVDAENIASIRLLEALGFRKEGLFVENVFCKGRWVSEMQFAMLRRDWNKSN